MKLKLKNSKRIYIGPKLERGAWFLEVVTVNRSGNVEETLELEVNSPYGIRTELTDGRAIEFNRIEEPDRISDEEKNRWKNLEVYKDLEKVLCCEETDPIVQKRKGAEKDLDNLLLELKDAEVSFEEAKQKFLVLRKRWKGLTCTDIAQLAEKYLRALGWDCKYDDDITAGRISSSYPHPLSPNEHAAILVCKTYRGLKFIDIFDPALYMSHLIDAARWSVYADFVYQVRMRYNKGEIKRIVSPSTVIELDN